LIHRAILLFREKITLVYWDRSKKTGMSPQSGKPRLEESDPCEDWTFSPQFKEKKINVFVSSTFKDMKAERDELTLRIFPILRKECEERGIAWGEVDLRWGIPEEKSEKGEALNICLDYIDKCRPYFISMLGERYGWIDPYAAEKVKNDHPWVKEEAGKSITELEILHGVLNHPEMADYAYFYFRDSAYLKSEEFRKSVKEDERADFFETDVNSVRKLSDLKQRIRDSGFPVKEDYPSPVVFGELVKADLMRTIDSLAPRPEPLNKAKQVADWLDREETAHEAFASSRFGVYISRQEYFDRLNSHSAADGPPLIVIGESGGGKSALLAHWAFRYRNQHPDDLVLVHFIGASSESSDWASMLRRFMGEFKRRFSLAEEIPVKEEELMAAFRNWLSMAAIHGRVVLVIDALNQLEDRNGAPDLVWLPPRVPANIRLIVSTLPGRPLDAARKRAWSEMTVGPLTVAEREDLITCYLRKYRRELDAHLQLELATTEQTKNPLFLRALLEELRVHGEFGRLSALIENYLAVQTVDELYEKILAQYELDYDRDRPGLVRDAVSLIWAARRGLSKSELMDLLGAGAQRLPDTYWAPLYLAIEHSLVEKDGRITFFHDYLKKAVERRYLATMEPKRISHLQIADYFTGQPDGIRKIDELPWQLAEAAEWDRLVGLLADGTFFLSLWKEREYDVKRYWVQMEKGRKYRMVDVYRPVIEEPASAPSSLIWAYHQLFYDTGHLNEASSLGDFLIKSLREQGNADSLAIALGNQAAILFTRGDLDGAMANYKEQEKICSQILNFLGLQASLGGMGIIFASRGNFTDAIRLYKEQEHICEKNNYIDELQACLYNQAILQKSRGDLGEAMRLYMRQEQICRKNGIINGLQMSFGNQAAIFFNKGNLKAAMDLYDEQERICREIGNIDSLQTCLGNKSVIYFQKGNIEKSLELLEEKEKYCRELNNLWSLQACLGKRAMILDYQGDWKNAIFLLEEQEVICRKINNPDWLATCLYNQALLYYNQGNLGKAMHLLEEQEQICRQLPNLQELQWSLGLQAGIYHVQGNFDLALRLYKEQEQISRDLPFIEGLARSLSNQGIILEQRNQHQEAVTAAEEAYRLASLPGYEILMKEISPNLNKILKRET
jgi:tetratricopeptide (TPR) repeat protein